MQGVIKTLRNGFGFISPGEGQKDIFFHLTKIVDGTRFDDLREGMKVEFEIGESAKGPAAENVKVIA